MKKLIALLLCLAMVLSMTACGADSKTTESEPQNTTSKVAEVPATTHQQVVPATTTVAPVSELPQVPGIDFQYEIDNFVPDYFNSRTLRVGEKDKAQGEVWLSSGQGAIYTSNENVVTVATNGAVTAVGEGTAYVLVVGIGNMHEITRYEVSGSLPGGAQSTEPDEKLDLPQVPGIDFQYEIDNFVPDYFNSRTLRVGEKDKAQGYIWLSSGQGAIYTSNANVVTVATNGAVTAVGEGTAYVLVVGIGNMHEITRYEVKGK